MKLAEYYSYAISLSGCEKTWPFIAFTASGTPLVYRPHGHIGLGLDAAANDWWLRWPLIKYYIKPLPYALC